MAFSHRIVVSYTGGSSSISFTETQEWGGEANLDESIPTGSTDLVVAYALDVSHVKSFLMTSDVEMTVKTNAGTDDTFSVGPTSGILFWTSYHQADGAAETQPFDADIADLRVTNSSGSAGTLQIRASYDPV